MNKKRIYILFIFFFATIWLSSPSLLLNLAGEAELKAAVGQTLLCLTAFLAAIFGGKKISIKAFLGIAIVLTLGTTVVLLYGLFDLERSINQLIGASLKVAIFVLLIWLFSNIATYINLAMSLAIAPLLIFSAFSAVTHNVLQVQEISRAIVGEQQVSILLTGLAPSRIHIGNTTFYRISSIFEEPGTYGLILYCILLFYKSMGHLGRWRKLVITINFFSTFSLGAFVSVALVMLSYASPKHLMGLFKNKISEYFFLFFDTWELCTTAKYKYENEAKDICVHFILLLLCQSTHSRSLFIEQ